MIYPYSGITNSLQILSTALEGVSIARINLKIIVRQSTGAIAYDEWNNPVLANSNTGGLTLDCTVRQTKDPLSDGNPGVNQKQIYLEGRLHSPDNFALPIPRSCPAEYLDDGRWRKGTFYPIDALNDSLTEAIASDKAFGRAIAGYLELLEGE